MNNSTLETKKNVDMNLNLFTVKMKHFQRNTKRIFFLLQLVYVYTIYTQINEIVYVTF